MSRIVQSPMRVQKKSIARETCHARYKLRLPTAAAAAATYRMWHFFLVIYEAEHTTLHINSEHDASQPHDLSAVSRRNDPAIVGSVAKRHAFFLHNKRVTGR